ncbi:hypothetical protein DW015_12810 [Ruminococcus sp. AF37-20]|jgi:hypothetical protein|uniref:hypothetical protein n=1 Tax=Ruminococcus sp. AF37-20 TaxID=2293178 RepID=UPI000E46E0A9|nr:hypothetical protein [Ruminococcus sp. AF37-20]RGF44211.1 hypothetical protein DW015_12810 [Ruminococcus sp. AF37-20]
MSSYLTNKKTFSPQINSYLDLIDESRLINKKNESISKIMDIDLTRSISILNKLNILTSSSYAMRIPTEVDIFSNLPIFVFSDSHNKQMGNLMRLFRELFIESIQHKNINKNLPKLEYINNENEENEIIQLHSTWDEGEALLYFSFESINEESSMGIIWNDNIKKNYETRAGNISLNNINDILYEAIDFIFRVY